MKTYKILLVWLAVVLCFGLSACGGGSGGGASPDSDGDGVPNGNDAFTTNGARFAAFESMTDQAVGTNFSVAVAANNQAAQAVLVGQSDLGTTSLRGQRWSINPGDIDPVPVAQTLQPLAGGSYSAAYGVTSAGLAVGESGTAGVAIVPVYWAAGSTVATALSLSDGTTTHTAGAAYGINESGQIVGELVRADGSLMAVLWQPTAGVYGNAIRLPELETGLSATAHAINASGRVAGESLTSNGLRGALWQVSAAGAVQGSTINLGTPDGSQIASAAFGVDDLGRPVGEIVSVTGTIRGVRWVLTGTTVTSTILLGNDSSAMAISDNNRIVGAATTAAEQRAAIWDTRSAVASNFDAILSSGAPLYTPTAGSSRAFGISPSGVVAGLAGDKAFLALPQ